VHVLKVLLSDLLAYDFLVDNIELKRLIDSTKDHNRKAALERSLEELNNRNVIGNDTILTSDFSSNHLMRVSLRHMCCCHSFVG
jgi:hypothetical protein